MPSLLLRSRSTLDPLPLGRQQMLWYNQEIDLPRGGPLPRGFQQHFHRDDMDTDIGLLWIPAGFILILVTVAALFLTI
jgi:hypothetical protein